MDALAIIAAKKAQRAASGLHVIVTMDNREPFNYFAKDAASRDEYMARTRALIGKPDPAGLGHVIRSVEIAA